MRLAPASEGVCRPRGPALERVAPGCGCGPKPTASASTTSLWSRGVPRGQGVHRGRPPRMVGFGQHRKCPDLPANGERAHWLDSSRTPFRTPVAELPMQGSASGLGCTDGAAPRQSHVGQEASRLAVLEAKQDPSRDWTAIVRTFGRVASLILLPNNGRCLMVMLPRHEEVMSEHQWHQRVRAGGASESRSGALPGREPT